MQSAKVRLHEGMQKCGYTLMWGDLHRSYGPPHAPIWMEVCTLIDRGETFSAVGYATRKKFADEAAAKGVLEQVRIFEQSSKAEGSAFTGVKIDDGFGNDEEDDIITPAGEGDVKALLTRRDWNDLGRLESDLVARLIRRATDESAPDVNEARLACLLYVDRVHHLSKLVTDEGRWRLVELGERRGQGRPGVCQPIGCVCRSRGQVLRRG